MDEPDYDNPEIEERWCAERRLAVIEYLQREGVKHGDVAEWPAWHVPPDVSIWAIESLLVPETVGWWVICGDLPTDYISAGAIRHPRDALRAFARQWLDVAGHMQAGIEHPTIKMGTPGQWPRLAWLLESHAELMLRWAGRDDYWESEEE